ncbi:MAG TPA: PD-(D/E)XK nuclease family protein [Gaiellaceae bacterium]|nr:PD-(D/E)XK nuclease family protein [Gaiellaceae bacterium]
MALTLLVGPANAGKVERLLDRYLDVLDREPVLIVPHGSDVVVRERELLARRPALLGGTIGTFDDLFRRLAPAGRTATDAQQTFVLRRAVARARLNGLAPSARSTGFVDALRDAVRELEGGLIEPAALDGDLAALYAAYREELDRLGLVDRGLRRAAAVERLRSEFDAWHGEPVFAYGFEDLTAAEWALLEALAARTDVTLSLPYEPGRAAFAALRTTAEDLAALAAGRVEELAPRAAEIAHPAIAHVERRLFEDDPGEAPALEGGVRFFEGAGTRGALELVAEEVLDLVRGGTPPERIAIVCPSLDRWRGPLETAFATLELPYAIEAPQRLAQTPYGAALLALLRYAWLDADRHALFSYLRSPYSGLARANVDFVEGRLRGRAITAAERVEAEMEALRGGPVPALEALRAGEAPVPAVRALTEAMLRAAFGTEAPPVGEGPRGDLRAFEAVRRLLDELDDWSGLAGPVSREDVVASLERATVRGASAGDPGRVSVTDLSRVRTRRLDVVFVLGLEEGSLPRRGDGSPFLGDDVRRALGGRLVRPEQAGRDRYLFYTACTRPTRRLYLVREAATDEGSPREPSPFWEGVAALFPAEEVARWTRRRALSALTWPLESAPSERERLRSLALLAADETEREPARAVARANGWERRLERALSAFDRRTGLRHPLVLDQLGGRSLFNVTELERFADCSSAWFFDRLIEPRTIDAQVDARLRGSVAHTALHRFFAGLPKELGVDRVVPERLEDALAFLRRCLEQAVDGQRVEMTAMERRELTEGLWRDLEAVVRDEAASEAPLVPRRFEVSFGSERSAQELQRGLELGEGIVLSGKIDRIDVDPFSARGMVQDYKAGKGAHSATQIEKELRLQIPLYMLVLRDLVGIEPIGGVYRPLAGDRKARGLLRDGEAPEGYAPGDYVEEEAFWGQVERSRETALRLAQRIRRGDVRHDPKGEDCPAWCDLWTMCRVRRA